jgi:hypothetical protein
LAAADAAAGVGRGVRAGGVGGVRGAPAVLREQGRRSCSDDHATAPERGGAYLRIRGAGRDSLRDLRVNSPNTPDRGFSRRD